MVLTMATLARTGRVGALLYSNPYSNAANISNKVRSAVNNGTRKEARGAHRRTLANKFVRTRMRYRTKSSHPLAAQAALQAA